MKLSTNTIRIAFLPAVAIAAAAFFASNWTQHTVTLQQDSAARPVHDAGDLTIHGSVADDESALRHGTTLAGVYGAAVGTNLRYRFENASDYDLDAKPSESSSTAQGAGIGFAANGILDVTVAARTADDVVVRARFGELHLNAQSPTAGRATPDWQRYEAATAVPLFVRLDVSGAVLGYGFDNGLDATQRNFLRGLLAPCFVAVPTDEPRTWEARAMDASGIYDAKYSSSRNGRRLEVQRTKTRYVEVAHTETMAPQTETRGSAQFEFDDELGWLRTMRFDETCRLRFRELSLDISLRQRGSLELESVTVDPSTVDTLPEITWQSASGHLEDAGLEADRAIDAARDAAARKLDPEALLRELEALLRQDPIDRKAVDEVWTKLVDRLRIDADTLRNFALRIEGGSLGEDIAAAILTAIGATNTPVAQEALDALRTSPRISESLRETAAIAMLQLASPTPRLLESIVAGLERCEGFDGLAGADLHLLGALSSRSNEPLANGRTAYECLCALESKAKRTGHVGSWLEAIGNTSNAGATDLCARYISDNDADVRRRAFSALRSIAEPRATHILTDRGLHDDDASVRGEAARALASHDGDGVTAALVAVAKNDGEAHVRLAALESLAHRRLDAPTLQTLRDIATLDNHEHVRGMARELLRRHGA